MSYKSDSHLSNTKTNAKFTELYEPGNELFTTTTKSIKIEPGFNRRPDLMAHNLYGNARLWWIFMHFNPDKIKDPVQDFTEGKSIVVPEKRSSTNTARL